jgi:hypothetical protein
VYLKLAKKTAHKPAETVRKSLGMSGAQLKLERERLARDFVRDLPTDLWSDP